MHARRVDTTHASIRDALRRVYGADNVIDTHCLGDDFPDLVLGVAGQTVLIECKTATRKDGGVKPSKVSPGQRAFAAGWRGGPVVQATSAEQALSLVRAVLLGGVAV